MLNDPPHSPQYCRLLKDCILWPEILCFALLIQLHFLENLRCIFEDLRLIFEDLRVGFEDLRVDFEILSHRFEDLGVRFENFGASNARVCHGSLVSRRPIKRSCSMTFAVMLLSRLMVRFTLDMKSSHELWENKSK